MAVLSKRLINGSPVTTRRAKAQWRRERLLDAALAVFVDKGIDGATVKDMLGHPVDVVSRGGLKARDRAILDEAIDL
jgi:hypothetical protein